MIDNTQHLLQERARREEVRFEKEHGFKSPVQCWKDKPEQCPYMPVFRIYQLDGSVYYACREDARELVDNLPDVPLKGTKRKGN